MANYINNNDLLNALIEYKKACEEAKREGKEDPPIPNYIGECFIKIGERFCSKPNFSKYSFKEEMIADGYENCIMYFRNFDPEKSTNPFSYFTQIIYFAFLRRIAKEKKQLYVKYKATIQSGILHNNYDDDGESGQMNQTEIYENISEFIENFEETRRKKKQKRTETNLAKFIEDDLDNIITEVIDEDKEAL